ncbi:hypothetical protein EDD86DRAFT_213840, partial [Gorgonomyces haynaldii]
MILDEEDLKIRVSYDNRQIKKLYSTYIEYKKQPSQQLLEQFNLELWSIEQHFKKHELMSKITLREVQGLEVRAQEQVKEMEEITQNIQVLKQDLEQAQQQRSHYAQYDEIANEILKLPSPQEYEQRLETIQMEIQALELEHEQLESKKQLKRTQFRTAILQLQEIL